MLKGVNDSIAQAKQLAVLVKGFPSLVNLMFVRLLALPRIVFADVISPCFFFFF
jgi:hypothetical protein